MASTHTNPSFPNLHFYSDFQALLLSERELFVSHYSDQSYGRTLIVCGTGVAHRDYFVDIIFFYEFIYLMVQVMEFFHCLEDFQFSSKCFHFNHLSLPLVSPYKQLPTLILWRAGINPSPTSFVSPQSPVRAGFTPARMC